MMIKAITIDFWNTLFDSGNGIERNNFRQRALIKEIDRLGVWVRNDEFNNGIRASWEHFNDIWINEQRTPSTFETVKFFWEYLNLPYEEDAVRAVETAFAESIVAHPPNLLPGVKEALDNFVKDYQIGLISDTGFSPGSMLKLVMENAGISHYFSSFSFSDETGVAKPHKKAFSTCLEGLGANPDEALHIGDIEKTDIVGAKACGMFAIRYTGDITGILNKKDKRSIADAKVESWEDIQRAVKSIESKISIQF